MSCFAGIITGIMSFAHFSAFERFNRSYAAGIMFFISSESHLLERHWKQFFFCVSLLTRSFSSQLSLFCWVWPFIPGWQSTSWGDASVTGASPGPTSWAGWPCLWPFLQVKMEQNADYNENLIRFSSSQDRSAWNNEFWSISPNSMNFVCCRYFLHMRLQRVWMQERKRAALDEDRKVIYLRWAGCTQDWSPEDMMSGAAMMLMWSKMQDVFLKVLLWWYQNARIGKITTHSCLSCMDILMIFDI